MSKLTKEEKLTLTIGVMPYIAELLEELKFAHNVRQDVNRVVKHLYRIGDIITDKTTIQDSERDAIYEQYHNLYVALSTGIEDLFINITRHDSEGSSTENL